MEFIAWLKERLKQDLPGRDSQLKMVPPEGLNLRFKPMENPVLSGVLLLLYKKEGHWKTVFTKRPEYNGHHSGQISLPGGKMEKQDTDLSATALRETFEEVGLTPADIQILGKLTTVQIPVSGFVVEPYVGYLAYEPLFVPDSKEVSKVIEADVKNFTEHGIKGMFKFERGSFAMDAPFYDLEGEKLWGATAMMISEFEVLLREFLKNNSLN